jgi:hypothetical protein
MKASSESGLWAMEMSIISAGLASCLLGLLMEMNVLSTKNCEKNGVTCQ